MREKLIRCRAFKWEASQIVALKPGKIKIIYIAIEVSFSRAVAFIPLWVNKQNFIASIYAAKKRASSRLWEVHVKL